MIPTKPWQKRIIRFLKRNERGIVTADSGMGKTRAACFLLSNLRDKRALVSAVKAVIDDWKEELSLHGLTYGPLGTDENVTLTNIEAIRAKCILDPKTRKVIRYNIDPEFDVVVLDENKYKNALTMSHSIGRDLVHRAMQRRGRAYLLSGTLFDNNLRELYDTLNLLDGLGDEIFGSWGRFYVRYCRQYGNRWVAVNVEELRTRLDPYFVHADKAELRLPEPSFSKILVRLSPLVKEGYDMLWTCRERLKAAYAAGLEYVDLEIGDTLVLHVRPTLLHIFSLLSLVRQYLDLPDKAIRTTVPCPTLDEVRRVIAGKLGTGLGSPKLDVLVHMAREGFTEPVLIFSNFTSVINVYARVLEEQCNNHIYIYTGSMSATSRTKTRLEAREDNTPFLFFTSRAGSFGMNMQSNIRNVITIDPPWTASGVDQTVDRIYRMGQSGHVIGRSLLCEGTYEEENMGELLTTKKRLLNDVVRARRTTNREDDVSSLYYRDVFLSEL